MVRALGLGVRASPFGLRRARLRLQQCVRRGSHRSGGSLQQREAEREEAEATNEVHDEK
jgi:hypothetical protein